MDGARVARRSGPIVSAFGFCRKAAAFPVAIAAIVVAFVEITIVIDIDIAVVVVVTVVDDPV